MLPLGLIDHSGMRVKITSKLRKNDAAIMELGLEYTDKMAIPPGVLGFPLSGYCIAECTQTVIYDIFNILIVWLLTLMHWHCHFHLPIMKAFTKSGINVFASQLHTHLRGARVLTRHFRDGYELPEINRDDYYSHHFQEIRFLRRQAKVLPVIW